MSKTKKECVYCGKTGKLTKDHIPPKNLFAKPRPVNLITVPCCVRCNRKWAKDDEYFRNVLSMKDKAGDHPDATKVRDATLRSLERPEARGFSKTFLRQVRWMNLRNKGGIYLPKKLTYNVDLIRLDRVAARIVKALFYLLKEIRVPDDYVVESCCEYGLGGLSNQEVNKLQQTVIQPVLSGSSEVLANNVMKYWVAFDKEKEYVSAWILEFYEDVKFLVSVLPKQRP